MREYVELPRPNLSWLVHSLIPKPSLMMLMGPPKEGKTFLASDLARSVAKGGTFLGQVVNPGRVLYLQLDTSEAVWRDRVQKQIDAGVEFPDDFVTVHPEDLKHPLDILQHDSRAWLDGLIREADPALVIVDVLREIHRADENDSTQMKIVGDHLVDTFRNRALFVLHHMRKVPADVSDPDPVSYGRGSSYITGKMDGYWMLHKGALKVTSRFDESTKYACVMGEDGTWAFPGVEHKIVLRDKLLALCAEFPDLAHGRLATVAKTRYGVSRPTYYRHMAGRQCAHVMQRSQGVG